MDEKYVELAKQTLRILAIPFAVYAGYRIINYFIPGAHRLPRMNFKDKVAVITGASKGLGRELAFELYKRGAKVILFARSTEELENICKELKQNFPSNKNEPRFYYLDIKNIANVPWDEINNVDILINNAGMSMRGSIEDTSLDIHRKVMEVNFFGHVDFTRAMLPKMNKDGTIVAISSVQGKVALPYRSSYSASKHALQAYFDSLRSEYYNKHVLTVTAGYINTGFGSRALDIHGKPVGVEDENQKKGFSPQYVANRIVNAIRDRESELIIADRSAKLAVLLRYLWPSLLNHILYARGQKEPWAKKEN